MKAKRRHELQTNELADWLGKEVVKVKPYTAWMLGGLIVFVIVYIVFSIRSSRLEAALAFGWESYESAQSDGFEAVQQSNSVRMADAVKRLREVADEFGGQPLAEYARMAIGDIYLQNATQQIETNKSLANDEFKRAAEQYADIAETATQSELKNRAVFCLAKAYEWQMQLSKACQHYAKVEGPFRATAQARLKDLERQSTAEFYEKFAEWKPKPAPSADDPSSRYPEFGLDDDPSGEIDYRRYLTATAVGLDVESEDDPAPPSTDGDETSAAPESE